MDIDLCQNLSKDSSGKNPYSTLTVHQSSKLFFKGILAFSLDYTNVYTSTGANALHFSLGLTDKPCLTVHKTLN